MQQMKSFLDDILTAQASDEKSLLDGFLTAVTLEDMLISWIQVSSIPEHIKTKTSLLRLISTEIARIDEILNNQFNVILHNPIVQQLEASWRGLALLVKSLVNKGNVKIRLLDTNWQEIHKDLARMDYEQSELYHKIYNQEFGTPGGTPFGLMIVDFYIHIAGSQSNKDIDVIAALSHIGASSFCPMITSINPQSFQIDSFSELTAIMPLEKTLKQPEYNRWNNFRTHQDARFIGIVLPRVILRTSYKHQTSFKNTFQFDEDTSDPSQKNYLWGNGCYAFALAAIRSFNLTGWFGEMIGQKDTQEGGGIVDQLPEITHHTDYLSRNVKYSTEAFISEQDENVYSKLGFIPICLTPSTMKAVFYSNNSAYIDYASTAFRYYENNISSKLMYMLCASRFAHYIKMMGRNLIGSLTSARAVETRLNNWIRKYLATNDVSNGIRAQRPLQGAKVEVTEIAGKPGCYQCIMHLQPRYQLEKVNTSLTLVTELAAIQS